jgi:AAA family ATP:ADP antiporter
LLGVINRLLRVMPGEWPKLAQFGLFGFLLQTGLGIGFSAGDAAFLARAGADRLALVFMITPVVMLLYTGVFSYLLVRFSIDRVVDTTIALLFMGGAAVFVILGLDLPPELELPVYFGLKLYLAMWYIALYSLFWNYTDTYFNIQDGKRLFPLLAAACALGTSAGGLLVSLLADFLTLRDFFLIWAVIALFTVPIALLLRRRWKAIADTEVDEGDDSVASQVRQVAHTFRSSRYTFILTLTLFVTLLLTNLAEFQYSSVFQMGRNEAELTELMGTLYASANLFNVFICLFVFNRLVGRVGVRNVALIMPISYFAAFGFLFVTGSFEGALACFLAYHGILTSIEYNNQNLLFNAVPSATKRPVRTIVEGLAEPLASFVAGGFLLYAADRTDLRDLSGLGVVLGVALMLVVITLRQLYPRAMARNMQAMLLDFGREGASRSPPVDPAAQLDTETLLENLRSPDRAMREEAAALLRFNRDLEAVPDILMSATWLSPIERHNLEQILVDWGETAIPRLSAELANPRQLYRARAVAARSLAKLSHPLFLSRLDALLHAEFERAEPRLLLAEAIEALPLATSATRMMARFQRQQIGLATDFLLELLALGGLLPDFDLLVVSLHSQNPKVRANAIEAIENGLDRRTFGLIKGLIEPAPTRKIDRDELITMLEVRLAYPNPLEFYGAAQTLRDLVPAEALGGRLRAALRPGLSPGERGIIMTLLGLDGARPYTVVDMIDAIAAIPDFAPASIEVQTRLTASLATTKPEGAALSVAVAGAPPMWLAWSDIIDLASRYSDLALSLLKARDDRAYAD